jgi:transposase
MNQNPSQQRCRARTTPAERTTWVRRFERSGLSQREFAARHHLGLSTLQKWIAQCSRLATASAAPRMWQELKLPATPTSARWAVERVRPDGTILRVAHDAPVALVAEFRRGPAC